MKWKTLWLHIPFTMKLDSSFLSRGRTNSWVQEHRFSTQPNKLSKLEESLKERITLNHGKKINKPSQHIEYQVDYEQHTK